MRAQQDSRVVKLRKLESRVVNDPVPRVCIGVQPKREHLLDARGHSVSMHLEELQKGALM